MLRVSPRICVWASCNLIHRLFPTYIYIIRSSTNCIQKLLVCIVDVRISWSLLSLQSNRQSAFSLGHRLPAMEICLAPEVLGQPSFKNGWIYTTIPSCILMVWSLIKHRGSFTSLSYFMEVEV
jgi:hypothetical protein